MQSWKPDADKCDVANPEDLLRNFVTSSFPRYLSSTSGVSTADLEMVPRTCCDVRETFSVDRRTPLNYHSGKKHDKMRKFYMLICWNLFEKNDVWSLVLLALHFSWKVHLFRAGCTMKLHCGHPTSPAGLMLHCCANLVNIVPPLLRIPTLNPKYRCTEKCKPLIFAVALLDTTVAPESRRLSVALSLACH